jgi:hypothetical protein
MASWADRLIRDLKDGKTVSFRPKGNSMQPRIENGQLVIVDPITDDTKLESGMIVLCSVMSRQYLHLIQGVNGDFFLIGNNKGGTNGWTNRKNIFGVLVRTE